MSTDLKNETRSERFKRWRIRIQERREYLLGVGSHETLCKTVLRLQQQIGFFKRIGHVSESGAEFDRDIFKRANEVICLATEVEFMQALDAFNTSTDLSKRSQMEANLNTLMCAIDGLEMETPDKK